VRALSIAATGMSAQETNVEVIANNIANINTTAFKRARAEFADLLYQAERVEGVPNRGGENPIPEGARIGLGVRTVGVRNLHIQGPLAQTSNPLDLALNGRGWFQIVGPGGETLYTRAGSFNKSATGQLVTSDGYAVDPAINFPQDTLDVVVNESGEVYARTASQAAPQLLGQLSLVNFADDAGLNPLGNNLYRETAASGQPIAGVAGDPGFGKISQGYLEGSNVDPVIQAADEMASTVSKGLR
jgi:flagellar basal-body rod protein FlgG